MMPPSNTFASWLLVILVLVVLLNGTLLARLYNC